MEIAQLFAQAAQAYQGNPTALHLRAMNILYEGLKEKGALMVVPSTAVETMGLGGFLGAAGAAQSVGAGPAVGALPGATAAKAALPATFDVTVAAATERVAERVARSE